MKTFSALFIASTALIRLGMGFKSFGTAAVTIAGIELAYRIRKHQFSFGRGRPRDGGSLKTAWVQALT